MTWSSKIHNVAVSIGIGILAVNSITQPAYALPQSTNIAYVQTQNVANGGSFPFASNPAFATFNFFQLPYNQVSTANLGPGGVCGASGCDTVLLNVASGNNVGGSLGYCNVSLYLSAQAKTDLVSFVVNGGKLIIYDSECNSQDYSWLPYPFTTNNPGARGGRGTVSIVEDNVLSSTILADPYYINGVLLGSNTDAVGDMNVMTTRDAAWCLDMSGTNILNVTGPTHTYARYGSGLFIYNGFDVDYMNLNTAPNPAVGPGNLAKIWLHELQVPFNPTPFSALPCGVSVVGITLSPPDATNDLSLGQNSHTVTATMTDLTGTPQPNVLVSFMVVSGPNAGASGTCSVNADCTSDANGEVSFTYSSDGSTGTDTIEACFTDATGMQQCSQDVTKEWITSEPPAAICDVDGDGDIDRADLSLISRSRNQPASSPDDPRDANGDGTITPADVKVCIPLCTLPGCAIQ
jgi:hypothetical protein